METRHESDSYIVATVAEALGKQTSPPPLHSGQETMLSRENAQIAPLTIQ